MFKDLTKLGQSYFMAVCLFIFAIAANAYEMPDGYWKTIDDETNKPRSVLKIETLGSEISAKIQKILPVDDKPVKNTCEKCQGSLKNKPLVGMNVLFDLAKDVDRSRWSGGQILDPKNGKLYKCYIEMDNDKTMRVRGYIGFSLLGRTQIWHKISEQEAMKLINSTQ